MEIANINTCSADSQELLALTISASISDYVMEQGFPPTVVLLNEKDVDDAVRSLPIHIQLHNLLPRLSFILGIMEE